MSIFYNEQKEEPKGFNIFLAILGLLVVIIVVWMSVVPNYRIYKQNKQGEANLRQQEWEKKILVEQAKAQNESATLQAEATIKQETAKAEAEVIRAKGVAEANRIISDSLKGNEAYLRYLWIDKLADNPNVIYVPTEAGLPILEAGRR
jgi:biopolymer transport protein ExbB/TolQ